MTVRDNWYEDFFQGLNCELWEKAASPEWTAQEVNFLVQEFGLPAGAHILDVPCGFGRHSVALAKRGFRVTGVDISERFITSLREQIAADNLTIDGVLGDIFSVQFDTKFSGAICMGNSFGYFSADKMRVFIGKVAASLEKGAKFIINSGMLAESILANFSEGGSYTFGDLTMNLRHSYNVHESCLVSNIEYIQSSTREEHAFKHYVFTLGEVVRLLQEQGLEYVAAYNSASSTKKESYNLGDGQAYIIAQKQ